MGNANERKQLQQLADTMLVKAQTLRIQQLQWCLADATYGGSFYSEHADAAWKSLNDAHKSLTGILALLGQDSTLPASELRCLRCQVGPRTHGLVCGWCAMEGRGH